MMDSLGISAEAIPVRSNSVAVIQATTYMCKLFYGVSQELFIWIKDLFIIGHEVSRKKIILKSVLAGTVLQESGLEILILLPTMTKLQSSLSIRHICSLEEFHCTALMVAYKTGFMTLCSTSTGKLIHWFMAWDWKESKLALSVIQHLTVKCCWCKCILNLV